MRESIASAYQYKHEELGRPVVYTTSCNYPDLSTIIQAIQKVRTRGKESRPGHSLTMIQNPVMHPLGHPNKRPPQHRLQHSQPSRIPNEVRPKLALLRTPKGILSLNISNSSPSSSTVTNYLCAFCTPLPQFYLIELGPPYNRLLDFRLQTPPRLQIMQIPLHHHITPLLRGAIVFSRDERRLWQCWANGIRRAVDKASRSRMSNCRNPTVSSTGETLEPNCPISCRANSKHRSRRSART